MLKTAFIPSATTACWHAVCSHPCVCGSRAYHLLTRGFGGCVRPREFRRGEPALAPGRKAAPSPSARPSISRFNAHRFRRPFSARSRALISAVASTLSSTLSTSRSASSAPGRVRARRDARARRDRSAPAAPSPAVSASLALPWLAPGWQTSIDTPAPRPPGRSASCVAARPLPGRATAASPAPPRVFPCSPIHPCPPRQQALRRTDPPHPSSFTLHPSSFLHSPKLPLPPLSRP